MSGSRILCNFSINPLYTNGIVHKVLYSYVYILRGHRLKFPKNIIFFSLKIDFLKANSADLDEMPHAVAFHLGLHSLQKNPFKGFPVYKGL